MGGRASRSLNMNNFYFLKGHSRHMHLSTNQFSQSTNIFESIVFASQSVSRLLSILQSLELPFDAELVSFILMSEL